MRTSLRASVGPTKANVARTTRPCSRKPVVVQASFLNDIGAAFAQIFSPLRRGNKEDWTGTGTPFTGNITPHSEARKPFKDGWQASPIPTKGKAPGEEPAKQDEQKPEFTPKDAVMTFLTEATENVIAHNFTGDATEPEAWKGPGEKVATGWTADIHTRGRDGFHSI